MNSLTYISCLGSLSIATGTTGSVVGLYDFSGVDISKLVYNQIHSQSGHYVSGVIFSDVLPLINRTPNLGNITPSFSGINCFSFGERLTGDFGVLIDFGYNGCLRNTTGKDYILLSSIPNSSGINTGFYIGVNEANRIFIQTSGIARSINQELRRKNFFHLSLSNQKYLRFGVFDFNNSNFIYESLELETPIPTGTPIYLGGFLNNTNTLFTGYSGTIQHVVLFNKSIDLNNIEKCIDCLFVTGISNLGSGTKSVSVPTITGFQVLNIYTTGITGYRTVSGNIPSSTGGTIPIYYQSGITGTTLTNTLTNIQTGTTNVVITGDAVLGYLYDYNLMNSYNVYSIEFESAFTSGDIIEIYTYNAFNERVNNKIIDMNWPADSGSQLIGNGLLETSGVDFSVITGKISGFFDDDVLQYDLISGNKYVLPYSGLWSRSRISMSGGSYYPPTSQYTELGYSGAIIITGISGNNLSGYDIYLNGQKLINGINYNRPFVGSSGTWICLSGSGLPDFFADAIYNVTGGLPTGIGDVQDSEMSFYPSEGSPVRFLFQVTGNGSGASISNVTGFSEQIWINGVRQSIDYQKNFECSLASGISRLTDYSFNFYNNDTRYFNIN